MFVQQRSREEEVKKNNTETRVQNLKSQGVYLYTA